ncbi:hypothetical protein, partial [Gordonia neofelifaecis]|uniref:hypothetical protein n=1 Tax=Gordonia neofelifaecis TaxID=945692 RepID=UPI001EE67B5B
MPAGPVSTAVLAALRSSLNQREAHCPLVAGAERVETPQDTHPLVEPGSTDGFGLVAGEAG